MKNYYLWVFVTIMLLGAETLTSAEIIPVWHNVNEAGEIHDMEFLRGEDQFILIAGTGGKGQIQIRQTLTGELVRSFPLPIIDYFNQLEITPDSMRFVITTGGDAINKASIEVRNISDFSLIKKLIIPMDADSVDKYNQPFSYLFQDIVIDPVRPYIYTFITKTNHYSDDVPDRTWLRVYNYETMEEVKDLTPDEFKGGWPDTDLYPGRDVRRLDVSDDGKYLAVLNEGKAYLKVWDLETMKQIINKQLYDDSFHNPDDYRCEVGGIEFSHIDNDLIYISGGYPNKAKFENSEYNPYGLYKYRFSTGDFYKNYLGFNPHKEFVLFDNEERVLLGSGRFVVLNQKTNKQEIYIIGDIKYPTGEGNLYSKKYNFFLGKSYYTIAGFRYDSQTSIEASYDEVISISPNPTSNFVNINIICPETTINYQINDINGLLINQSTVENSSGSLQIDFSLYSAGIYFLTVSCGKGSKTYKIIKEG